MENRQPPKFPVDALHAALPDGSQAHARIDDLDAELQRPEPASQAIHAHIGFLRALPELEAIVVNWWDDPSTQSFIDDLIRIGL